MDKGNTSTKEMYQQGGKRDFEKWDLISFIHQQKNNLNKK